MHPRAEQLIRALELRPHPEGGHYAEVHRSAASTSIYFLLAAGELSRWHRVRSEEIWHFYEGSPLELLQLTPAWNRPRAHRAGSGERPRAAGSLRARRLLAGGAVARRLHARRVYRRAGVPIRRFCAAQGFAGACGVHPPKSPGRRSVRVAYEYEVHTFRPHRCGHDPWSG